jgi:addiction module HigA family antidote
MKFTRFVKPSLPGEILVEEFLKPKAVSQREFARKIGWSPRKVNEIAVGKRALTAASCIDLAEALGTSPEFWMNLQTTWDLAQAYRARKAS